MTVMVKKVGGSVAVVIPKAIAQEIGLSEGTPLEITSDSGSIVMRRRGSRPRRSLRSIVKQIDPAAYRRRRAEFPDSPPVGKEIW